MRRLAAIVVLFAALAAACAQKPKVAFRTEEATRGDVTESVTATGEVGAIQTVSVGTQVSGTISRMYVDYNSTVRRGQRLADIDTRLFKAAVARAEASLAAARAEVDKAKALLADATRTHERSRKLVQRDLAAQAELDTALAQKEGAEAGVQAAEARVQLARAELETARTNIQLCRIRSPIDGIVLSRATDVGQTVAASFQSPTLFTIANDLTRMQILANVDEADIGKVQAGMPVTFGVEAYPGEKFQGRIREVRAAPTTVQNVVTYTAVVDAPNPDRRLRQGMTASVSVAVQKREKVLRVPNAALRYRPPEDPAAKPDEKPRDEKPRDEKAREPRKMPEGALAAEGAGRGRPGTVHRLVDGKPVAVEVVLGLSDGRATEVISGLSDGDQLVVGDSASRAGGPGGPPGGGRGRPF